MTKALLLLSMLLSSSALASAEQAMFLVERAPHSRANLERAVKLSEDALEHAPPLKDRVALHLNVARAAIRLGEMSRGISWFERATRHAERTLALDTTNLDAKFFVAVARLLRAEREGGFAVLAQVGKSRQALESIVRAAPDHLLAREALARVYWKTPALAGGSSARAIKLLEANLTRDPRFSTSRVVLAEVLSDTGDDARAARLLREVIDEDRPTFAHEHARFARPRAKRMLRSLRARK